MVQYGGHKIIKRKNGKYVKVVFDNLANFLSISPNVGGGGQQADKLFE
jgi:hypothetical protein